MNDRTTQNPERRTGKNGNPQGRGAQPDDAQHPLTDVLQGGVCRMPQDPDFVWSRRPMDQIPDNFQLRLEMTLTGPGEENLGTLVLLKNGRDSRASHYTLKRVEHLRRNLVYTLERLLRKR